MCLRELLKTTTHKAFHSNLSLKAAKAGDDPAAEK